MIVNTQYSFLSFLIGIVVLENTCDRYLPLLVVATSPMQISKSGASIHHASGLSFVQIRVLFVPDSRDWVS